MEEHTLTWRGITVCITYQADISPTIKRLYDYPLAQLEIESIDPPRTPLPIAPTGYKRHYANANNVAASGGPTAYVRQCIDSTTDPPHWTATKQLTLI